MKVLLKSVFLIALFSGICNTLYAQQVYQEEVPLKFQNFISAGGGLHNAGWYFTSRFGIEKSGKTNRIYEFDISKIKSPREYKYSNPGIPSPKPYIYGKQYDFFACRFGTGFQKLIFDKSEVNGLEIRYQISGGLSLAALKPVYLDILYVTSGQNPQLYTETERYDPARHYPDNIYGGAGFLKGFNEMEIKPGLYGKFAMVFDWAKYQEDISHLEAGISIDAFPKEIPLMANQFNKNIFISFFIGFQLGQRW